MGLFRKPNKGEKKKQPGSGQEPVFYEVSGGVTREQALGIIQGLTFSPAQSPMGVVGGEHDYGIISYPAFVLIFFHQDSEHPIKIQKRDFMPLEGILENARFYAAQGDFEAAAACVAEGLEKNGQADEHWELYRDAGTYFWRLRNIELANHLFLKAYQCTDCDQKAHVLCLAAATFCILQDPNKGFALYHKALEEEPESLEVRHNLGGFHWDMGELDKAADYYFSVLKKDPAYYDSYEELSNLFRQLGNTRWPRPFMDCFQGKKALGAEDLAAAEADMTALLARQKKS